MTNASYRKWLCRKAYFVFVPLYLSTFIILFFYDDKTIHSFMKRLEPIHLSRDLYNDTLKEVMVLTTRRPITYSTTTTTTTTKSLQQKKVSETSASKSLKKDTKFLTLKQFSYPLEIDLVKLVKERLENNTPIKTSPINPHPFQYIHKPHPCDFSKTEEKRTLLVLVKSAANNIELRQAIRNTWGSINATNIRIVYLLAMTDDNNQTLIDNESNVYNDIIQEDFMDAYLNNTHKTIMGFNWGVTHCSGASFFFFVDDDHYVLLKNVVNFIENIPKYQEKNLFTGFLLPNSEPFRNEESKWFVAREDYPFNRWQPYLAGGAYISSLSVAQRFQIAFPFIKYLGIDDSYLGIVAKKLAIKPTHNGNFNHRGLVRNFEKSYQRQRIFASHGFKDPMKMKETWNNFHKKPLKT